MFTKDEVLKNLHENILICEETWGLSGDIVWQQAIDDKKHELAMTKEIPDDENFFYNRGMLLEQHGFLQRSLDRLDRMFLRNSNEAKV